MINPVIKETSYDYTIQVSNVWNGEDEIVTSIPVSTLSDIYWSINGVGDIKLFWETDTNMFASLGGNGRWELGNAKYTAPTKQRIKLVFTEFVAGDTYTLVLHGQK